MDRDHGGPSAEELKALVTGLLSVRQPAELRTFLETHPVVYRDDVLAPEVVAVLDRGADSLMAENPELAAHLSRLAALLRRCHRFGVKQALVDWTSGVDYLTPPSMEDVVRAARDAERRYRGGRPQALDEAIDALEAAVGDPAAMTVLSDFVLGLMNDLGRLCRERYQLAGRVDDLVRAVDVWRQAIAASPDGWEGRPRYQNNLGAACLELYERTSEGAALDEAVTMLRHAVSAASPSTPERGHRRAALASALLALYEERGEPEILDELVGLLDGPEPGLGPTDHRLDRDLAVALLMRYRHREDPDDLDRAITALRSVATDSDGSVLVNLGLALRLRYELRGDTTDLDEAIRLHTSALELIAVDHSVRASACNNLGQSLLHRYDLRNDAADVDWAIELLEMSVAQTPEGSVSRPQRLNILALALAARQEAHGHPADLDRAIELSTAAVASERSSSPERCGWLCNLADHLRKRFEVTGDLADIHQAVSLAEQAVACATEGSRQFVLAWSKVAEGTSLLYWRTGELHYLDRSVEAFERAFAAAVPGSLDQPAMAIGYGTGLLDRYLAGLDRDDLELAVTVLDEAMAMLGPESRNRTIALHGLGFALSVRYKVAGDDADFAAAADRLEALAAAPKGRRVDEAPLLLADLLSSRHSRTGDRPALDRAIGLYDQALAGLYEDSPDALFVLNNLALVLADRHGLAGGKEDARRAVEAYRACCERAAGPRPSIRLKAASNWARWAARRMAWAEVVEAYKHGAAAARQLQRTQLLRSHRTSWLTLTQGMAADAAYALAKLRRPQEAVLALEGGRATLLSEALDLVHAGLQELRNANHAELADRFEHVAGRVAALQAEASGAALGSIVTLDPSAEASTARSAALERARDELDAAVAAIRRVPGYQEFLAEITFDRIAEEAASAPVAYLAASAAGGVLLTVLPDGSVDRRWLPELTGRAVRERVGAYLGAARQQRTARPAWLDALDQVTGWLWHAAMDEVVASVTAAGDQGKATLVPVGLLGLLPLHAAWTTDAQRPSGRRYVLDELVLSYAPSVRAIRAARRSPATAAMPKALFAVREPAPVSAGPLPMAGPEVDQVRRAFSRYRVLSGRDATARSVVQALRDWPVLHFACHGLASVGDPLRSRLLLAYDEELTLRQVLNAHLPDTRLVVLSACETAVPGADLPDEALSLAAGFLQAGAAGVVGSLWAINDDSSSALLMSRFYDLWMRDGRAPAEALRSAQHWVRDATNAEKVGAYPGLFARTSNSPLWRGARMHHHPHHWAAFAMTGV